MSESLMSSAYDGEAGGYIDVGPMDGVGGSESYTDEGAAGGELDEPTLNHPFARSSLDLGSGDEETIIDTRKERRHVHYADGVGGEDGARGIPGRRWWVRASYWSFLGILAMVVVVGLYAYFRGEHDNRFSSMQFLSAFARIRVRIPSFLPSVITPPRLLHTPLRAPLLSSRQPLSGGSDARGPSVSFTGHFENFILQFLSIIGDGLFVLEGGW
jgi:hypothetical protein